MGPILCPVVLRLKTGGNNYRLAKPQLISLRGIRALSLIPCFSRKNIELLAEIIRKQILDQNFYQRT